MPTDNKKKQFGAAGMPSADESMAAIEEAAPVIDEAVAEIEGAGEEVAEAESEAEAADDAEGGDGDITVLATRLKIPEDKAEKVLSMLRQAQSMPEMSVSDLLSGMDEDVDLTIDAMRYAAMGDDDLEMASM